MSRISLGRYNVSVGPSNIPIAMAVQSWWIGSQNRVEPHMPQNPRRTLSED